MKAGERQGGFGIDRGHSMVQSRGIARLWLLIWWRIDSAPVKQWEVGQIRHCLILHTTFYLPQSTFYIKVLSTSHHPLYLRYLVLGSMSYFPVMQWEVRASASDCYHWTSKFKFQIQFDQRKKSQDPQKAFGQTSQKCKTALTSTIFISLFRRCLFFMSFSHFFVV